MNDERRPARNAAANSAAEDVSSGRSQTVLTPLQCSLIDFYSLLEHGRADLTPKEFRTFVWILTDRIGEEAARLVVEEALEATSEEAA